MTRRINPLSRRPQQRRLVMAVRGAAGAGKSVFAASLADADLGRLCFFDTERKGRLLPGADGSAFDAIEVRHPDELPEFIDWALDGEGREQGYGCYALDSWAMYFGRKHRQTIQAVRARTDDPTAQPSAEELQSDQLVLQEVLRRLCVDSGACVVITDQIAAKGKEEQEENQLGRVLPLTTGGLEYFVDVMVELSLRVDGFEQVRVATVVKSNVPALPVGLEVVNPTFRAFLDLVGEGPQPQESEQPELLDEAAPVVAPAGPTVDDLLAAAASCGVDRAALLVAARHYCGVADLDRLTPEQVASLLDRMRSRYGAGGDSAGVSGDDVEVSAPKRRSRAA
ncbi:MAG: hypothetical protein ABJF88_13835 [Rhodothermales bacterium]